MDKNKKKPLNTPETFDKMIDKLAGYITILSFVWGVIKGIVEWLA